MTDFSSAVSTFLLQEKGINVRDSVYMEMPNEKERYNLSKTIGNVNLTERRYKTKSEADTIVSNFLSMSLP
jgi:hypothetical protein